MQLLIILIAVVTIFDRHLYIRFQAFICSVYNNCIIGFLSVFYFMMVYMGAWKLYVASRDIAEFVLNKQLSTEEQNKRNMRIYSGIWWISILFWVTYMTFIIFFYAKHKDNSVVIFNFSFLIVLSLLLLLSSVLFLLSFIRFGRVIKATDTQRNCNFLTRGRLITGSFVASLICSTLLEFFGIYTQGYFGDLAITSAAATQLYFFVTNLLFFWLSLINPDFSLKTKVLGDGDVLIVGVDANSREIFKIYLNEQKKDKEGGVRASILNQWNIV